MWSSEFRPLSIRLRLLLFLGLGLGALVVVLFVVLDKGVERQVYAYLDNTLGARAHGITVLLESHPASEALAELQAMSPGFAHGEHTDFLQLWNADGHTLLASDSNAAATLNPPRDVPANRPLFYDLTLPDGHRGRAIAVRVSLQGRTGDAILVVVEEREQVYALESRLHMAVTTGVVVTSLFGVLLAVLIVRGGLRPLRTFGDAARRDAETSALRTRTLPRELRPLADALNDAFGRLRHALQRERRFTRDVAHELRTPLAEIRTALELAQRDANASPALDGALVSSERMARAVDGLLSLSRYESGVQDVQVEPADLCGLLGHTLALADGMARRRRVSLRLDAPEECWIQTDPALLERILDNLLLNAAEHAPEGSEIELQLQCAGNDVALCIGNLAPSLETADLERLRERFWRKSPQREASRHGGLGLALTGSLADLLDLDLSFKLDAGMLWVDLRGLRGLST